MIPLSDPGRFVSKYRSEIDRAVQKVLSSGIYILGPENEDLERRLANLLGINHVTLVGNGTDAIEISLRAVGVKPGGTVVTVANAGGYTSVACSLLGAKPVFVDVDPQSLQMDPRSLEEALSKLPESPQAIVVTHLFGQAAPIGRLTEVANAHGIPLIEDCAQALGAEINGRKVGSFGQISTTSFYPTKNLGGVGDGGAIFSNNAELSNSVRKLRQYGWGKKYSWELSGGRNSRMDELQCAMVSVALDHFAERTIRRQEIHSRYTEMSNSVAETVHSAGESFVAHLAVLRSDSRELIQKKLSKMGVQTAVHYPIPDSASEALGGISITSLAVTEQEASKIFSVPIFPEMSNEEVEIVASAILGLEENSSWS